MAEAKLEIHSSSCKFSMSACFLLSFYNVSRHDISINTWQETSNLISCSVYYNAVQLIIMPQIRHQNQPLKNWETKADAGEAWIGYIPPIEGP